MKIKILAIRDKQRQSSRPEIEGYEYEHKTTLCRLSFHGHHIVLNGVECVLDVLDELWSHLVEMKGFIEMRPHVVQVGLGNLELCVGSLHVLALVVVGSS